MISISKEIADKVDDIIPESMKTEEMKKIITIHADMNGSGKCDLRRDDVEPKV